MLPVACFLKKLLPAICDERLINMKNDSWSILNQDSHPFSSNQEPEDDCTSLSGA